MHWLKVVHFAMQYVWNNARCTTQNSFSNVKLINRITFIHGTITARNRYVITHQVYQKVSNEQQFSNKHHAGHTNRTHARRWFNHKSGAANGNCCHIGLLCRRVRCQAYTTYRGIGLLRGRKTKILQRRSDSGLAVKSLSGIDDRGWRRNRAADPRRQSGRIAELPDRYANAGDAVRDQTSRPNQFPTGS